MATVLSVRGLKTQFFAQDGVVQAVNGISYELNEGETLGIVGESGCGKSVSVMSLMRLIPMPPGKIVGGEAIFENRDLAGGSIRVLRRPRAPRALTIDLEHDNVRFGSMTLTYDTLKTGTTQHGPPAIGAVRRESGMGVRVGRRRPGFEARVASAFELLDLIWPQAALRVAEQTWLVVPVEEWGTVSYSSPRLPGVTFVNVRSSPIIRLAEDLLHEGRVAGDPEIEHPHTEKISPALESEAKSPLGLDGAGRRRARRGPPRRDYG